MGRLFLLGLAKPPADLEPEPELEGLLTPVLEVGDTDEGAVTRPLSPTRLQPALPPEAQSVPELEEVARVLAEIPRPLKRRGSMEQSPAVALPPTHKKQYQQIISRLFHRHGGPGGPEPELSPITEGSEARAGPPAPAPPAPILPSAPLQSSPPEQPQSMVSNTGGTQVYHLAYGSVPSLLGQNLEIAHLTAAEFHWPGTQLQGRLENIVFNPRVKRKRTYMEGHLEVLTI